MTSVHPSNTPPESLTQADRALLLSLADPTVSLGLWESPPSDNAGRIGPTAPAPDPLQVAAFCTRPEIARYLQALESLRAFRRELKREHHADQAIDALLHVARTTDDLVEKRLAATAVIRLIYPPRARDPARRPSERPECERPRVPAHESPKPKPRPDQKPTAPTPAHKPGVRADSSAERPRNQGVGASCTSSTLSMSSTPSMPAIPGRALSTNLRADRFSPSAPHRRTERAPSRAETLARAAGIAGISLSNPFDTS